MWGTAACCSRTINASSHMQPLFLCLCSTLRCHFTLKSLLPTEMFTRQTEDLIWGKGKGLKEVSKAKTKTLPSPQNIPYPTHKHKNTSRKQAWQPVKYFVSNPFAAILESKPKHSPDVAYKRFPKLFFTCLTLNQAIFSTLIGTDMMICMWSSLICIEITCD